jgi:hypothetical protein
VGYYLWLEADKAGWKLDQTNVQRGIAAAQRRNTLVVVESALSDISERDREFLDAMAAQDGPSAAGQIGAILNARPNVISKSVQNLTLELAFLVLVKRAHPHVPYPLSGHCCLQTYARAVEL